MYYDNYFDMYIYIYRMCRFPFVDVCEWVYLLVDLFSLALFLLFYFTSWLLFSILLLLLHRISNLFLWLRNMTCFFYVITFFFLFFVFHGLHRFIAFLIDLVIIINTISLRENFDCVLSDFKSREFIDCQL